MTDTNSLRESIREAIRESVHRIAGITPGEVLDTSTYREDLGLDSLSALEVMVDIEYAFKIKVAEGQLQTIRTVQDTIDVVEGYLSAARAQA